MLSATSIVLLGAIILVAIVVIVKWWKSPKEDNIIIQNEISQLKNIVNEETTDPPSLQIPSQPPPMVFAVNDQGNLDLTDIDGKILNIGYGPNPKTYINLLDQAEKDTKKDETEQGVFFVSNVGNTKLYEAAGRPYIINYTRL